MSPPNNLTNGIVDEPQLLEVNLVRSNGSPALTGHHIVDILPQPDISSRQKHFVSSGWQVFPLTRAVDLEPGDLVRVADAALLRVPLGALQHTTHAAGPHPGQVSDSQSTGAPMKIPRTWLLRWRGPSERSARKNEPYSGVRHTNVATIRT